MSAKKEHSKGSGPDPRLSASESNRLSAAMDRAFALQIQHGYPALILRGLFQLFAWAMIAYLIQVHQLSPLLVAAPWILEFLLLTWMGPLLSRWIVDDPIFRKISGRLSHALAWSFALILPCLIGILLQNGLAWDRFLGALEQLAREAWEHNLVLVGALVIVGLMQDTAQDIRQWRARGGPFVWAATLRFGLRFAALLALLVVTPFLLGAIMTVWDLFAETSDWFSRSIHFSWLVFTLMGLADLGELLLTGMLVRRSRTNVDQGAMAVRRRSKDIEPDA